LQRPDAPRGAGRSRGAGRPAVARRAGLRGKKIIVQKKLFLLTAKKFFFGDLRVSWSSLQP
jgi:hypothetical protein